MFDLLYGSMRVPYLHLQVSLGYVFDPPIKAKTSFAMRNMSFIKCCGFAVAETIRGNGRYLNLQQVRLGWLPYTSE